MDIQYLLFLQNFRNSINDALTPFMEMISLLAVTYLIIVPTLVYWCVDKRSGLYTLTSLSSCNALNSVIKLTACVYRPWIRDSRILPAGDAISTATGYSFPSGHTTTATSIYGGLAASAWKKMRWVSVLCIILILLTGFSRNYLGVHTPQDVAVGLTEGVLVLWGMSKLFGWLEAHPEKENLILGIALVLCAAALFYFTNKSYPMDYVDGKLLVDPQKMMKDGYGDVGALVGLCLGRFIEKTWVRFQPTCSRQNVVAGLVGAVITYCLITILGDPMQALFGLHWGAFARTFIVYLFIIVIWPVVMKKVLKEEAAAA